jgi:photosystem II stability/assembly factor-like uncharacterized protein
MASWVFIGPVLGGGDVLSLVASSDASHEGVILAGTAVGLYRSTDEGHGWQLISGELGLHQTTCLAISPDYPKDPTIILGGAPGVILRSLDGGGTWQSSVLDIPDAILTALALSPAFSRDGFLLAGTLEDGIYRSTTRGRHWETANFGLVDLQVWALAISPAWETDETALAIVGEGLFRTTNGARAWKEVGGVPDDLIPQSVAFSPDYGRDRVILLGTVGDGIWRSQDPGGYWAQVQGTEGMDVNCLLVSSPPEGQGGRTLHAGTVENGVLRSRDGGVSWESLGGPGGLPVLSLAQAVSLGSDLLVAGVASQGVFKLSGEGNNWIWIGQGLAARQLRTIAASVDPTPQPTVFVGGAPGLLLRSDNGGQSWQLLGTDLLPETDVHCIALSPTFSRDGLVLAGAAGKILRSVDGGTAWAVTTEVPDEEVRAIAYSPVFAGDGTIWACTDGHLLCSRDGGRNWTAGETSLPEGELTSMALSPHYASDRTLLVTTTMPGEAGWTHRLRRSTDGGRHWQSVWEYSGPSPWLVLAAPREDAGAQYAYDGCLMATGCQVFAPAEGGRDRWLDRRLPDEKARVLSFLVTSEGSERRTWLAGTTRGLFLSRDEGQNWEWTVGGPGLQPILALALSPGNAMHQSVWVLALGGALWRYEFQP